ncbi:phosphodiester glycosidase family protein [Tepidamorphus sp. 3E244]|uniref:phosphodiester glycosidase family protein n=1 Tax=Tepidamorphus sp. 3E244 TaxID=3385498 RepID=UPI0038FC0016
MQVKFAQPCATLPATLVLAAIAAAALLAGPSPARAQTPVACEKIDHKAMTALVCRVDMASADLRLFLNKPSGNPFGGFGPLRRELETRGKSLVFAMNGGMYHEDLSPVGLYVEDGKRLKEANTNAGPGNFHMLPNGVFWFGEGKAGVTETKAFVKSRRKPSFATQSGPMLVIGGKLHHRFLPDSTSHKVRNGVGVRDGGRTAVFAISQRSVTFHDFATLFRDKLGCNDALFLDGSISSIYAPQAGRIDFLFPMGPIIAVVE